MTHCFNGILLNIDNDSISINIDDKKVKQGESNKLHGLYILNMVSKIILHYNDVIKENIPVSIIKLLE